MTSPLHPSMRPTVEQLAAAARRRTAEKRIESAKRRVATRSHLTVVAEVDR